MTILFVYLLCIIGLPLGLAIVTAVNWQFRRIPTLIAACAGEIAGFVLLFVYAGWKAARVLSHKESGAVLYLDHVDLSTRIVNTLIFLSLSSRDWRARAHRALDIFADAIVPTVIALFIREEIRTRHSTHQ